MQINTKNLIKEISEQEELSEEEIKKVISSPFEFTRLVMANNPSKSVRLKRFGMFCNKKLYLDKKVKRGMEIRSQQIVESIKINL